MTAFLVSPLQGPGLWCPKIDNPSCWAPTNGRTINPKIRTGVLKVRHPKTSTNRKTPKRMQLCEQESHMWLNASGQRTREREVSPKSLWSPGWLWAQPDGCMLVLPLARMYPMCTTGVTQDEPHWAAMLWVTSTESTLYALCISSPYTQCVQCRCYKVRYLPFSWKMCEPQAGQSGGPPHHSPLLFLCHFSCICVEQWLSGMCQSYE